MTREVPLDTDRILATVDDDGVGWLIFNNPARHNALSLAMWQGIADALDVFQSNGSVRAVVMRGAGGKAFISGADISEFDAKRASAAQRASYGEIAAEANRRLARFAKPLVAWIEGYCIGGGLATALYADVRFATDDARFAIPAARLGLGYEYDGIAKLARLVGPSNARDILFSARHLNAGEARAMGLVNFVFDRDDMETSVHDYVSRIGNNAPMTIAAAKAAIDTWERGGRQEDIENVKKLVDECFDSADYKEGRRAFREKRTPDFQGH